jgi:hypothetical protein
MRFTIAVRVVVLSVALCASQSIERNQTVLLKQGSRGNGEQVAGFGGATEGDCRPERTGGSEDDVDPATVGGDPAGLDCGRHDRSSVIAFGNEVAGYLGSDFPVIVSFKILALPSAAPHVPPNPPHQLPKPRTGAQSIEHCFGIKLDQVEITFRRVWGVPTKVASQCRSAD